MAKPLRWSSHDQLSIQRRPCLRREQYLDYMTFRSPGPVPFTEIFGPIIGLKEEWLEQGATPQELDFSVFRYRCAQRGWLPIHTGRMGGQTPKILEETEDHVLSRDELGRTMKLAKGSASLPLPLDWPVKTMADWAKIKHLYTYRPQRLAGNWQEAAEQHIAAGRVVTVSIPGGFDQPRQLMGEEALCMAFYDQPELIFDMLATFADTAGRVLTEVVKQVQVDVLFVHEDMAGKSGPLIGPRQVSHFIAPYYRQIWKLLASHGARLFDQDSDGNMLPVIDAFLDAGVNCMHPIEPAAGMDPVALREKYGRRLAMYGGIDKHVLRSSKADIEAELRRKILPLARTGGYEIAVDHRIPNGTPLENYRFYVSKVWQILEEIGQA